MNRKDLESLQLERLQATVKRVYEKNSVYRKSFELAGVTPQDIKSLSDIQKLPTINKTIFRDTYPMGLMCVDKKEIVDLSQKDSPCDNTNDDNNEKLYIHKCYNKKSQ